MNARKDSAEFKRIENAACIGAMVSVKEWACHNEDSGELFAVIVEAAQMLEARETANPDLWENSDWRVACERIARQIEQGEPLDLKAALDPRG